MAGDPEEVRARAALMSMQERIARGPHSALNVPPNATPAEMRAAFLSLTKQYHPARFGRMSSDVQRLSNEVFLGIRGAHDTLAKAAGIGSPGRPGAQPRTNGAASAPTPSIAPTKPPSARPGGATAPTAPTAPTPAIQPPRPPTGPIPVRRPPTAQSQPLRPPTGPQSTLPVRPPTGPMKPMPSTVATTLPGSVRAAQVQARTSSPSPPPPSPTPVPPTRSSSPVSPQPAAPTPTGSPERDVATAHDLLRRGQWASARQLLQAVSGRNPTSKPYLALLAYARGREALAAGRADEAHTEVQRALQLDPGLELARTALAEHWAPKK